MGLALYRKYRPATFSEVVGQEHVTGPLMTAVDSGRINHAYLFSGPRGCGKTSSARILARSLNCVEGPTSTPCGTCQSCLDLAPDGPGNIDVIEIDAASHGGVDDARDLRERAFQLPVSSRYKIYIIDEAHMVSNQGFNALLKVVEEPPESVVFIFATTEPDKVLPTIRSRTHHYPFRLVPPAAMRGLLERNCESEGIAVGEAVLPLVVRAGGGSVRDSQSLLDQLIAGAGTDGITYDAALALLGVTDAALLDDMVEAIGVADGATVFGTVGRLIDAGHDPRRFATDLLDRLRDLILLAAVPNAGEKGLIDAPDDHVQRLVDQAGRLGLSTLSRLADIVHDGLTEMRGTTAPRLGLELICARMLLPKAGADPGALVQRIERLERRLDIGGSTPQAAGRTEAAARSAERPADRPGPTRSSSSADDDARPQAQATGQSTTESGTQSGSDDQAARSARSAAAHPAETSAAHRSPDDGLTPRQRAQARVARERASDPAPSHHAPSEASASRAPASQDAADTSGREVPEDPRTEDPTAQPHADAHPAASSAPEVERPEESGPAPATGIASSAAVEESSPASAPASASDAGGWPEVTKPGSGRRTAKSVPPAETEARRAAPRSEPTTRESTTPEATPGPATSRPTASDASFASPSTSESAQPQSTTEPPTGDANAVHPETSEQPIAQHETSRAERSDSSFDVAEVRRQWPTVVDAIKKHSRAGAALVEATTPLRVDGSTLVLTAPSGLVRRVSDPSQQRPLLGALHEVLGVTWQISAVAKDDSSGTAHVGSDLARSDSRPPDDYDYDPDDRTVNSGSGSLDPNEAAMNLLREELGAQPLDEQP